MYLNLLFKSLKADENKERVKAFVRRFVQVLGSGGGGGTEFVAGGLYLLGEVSATLGTFEVFTDRNVAMTAV
jgi:ribosome biogenesis protein MAK21